MANTSIATDAAVHGFRWCGKNISLIVKPAPLLAGRREHLADGQHWAAFRGGGSPATGQVTPALMALRDLEWIDESVECESAFGPKFRPLTPPGLLVSRLRRIWVAVLGIAPSISACASNGC